MYITQRVQRLKSVAGQQLSTHEKRSCSRCCFLNPLHDGLEIGDTTQTPVSVWGGGIILEISSTVPTQRMVAGRPGGVSGYPPAWYRSVS